MRHCDNCIKKRTCKVKESYENLNTKYLKLNILEMRLNETYPNKAILGSLARTCSEYKTENFKSFLGESFLTVLDKHIQKRSSEDFKNDFIKAESPEERISIVDENLCDEDDIKQLFDNESFNLDDESFEEYYNYVLIYVREKFGF